MTGRNIKELLKPYYLIVDECFKNTPLVILGSGASMDFGFPSMKELGEQIKQQIEAESTFLAIEQEIWNKFKSNFDQSGDFEKALDSMGHEECTALRELIIDKVWEIISEIDKNNYNELLNNNAILPLSKLFNELSRGNPKVLKVVTTNYDRLAEYAAELADFNHYTGFSYGYIRFLDEQIGNMPLTVARRRQRKK